MIHLALNKNQCKIESVKLQVSRLFSLVVAICVMVPALAMTEAQAIAKSKVYAKALNGDPSGRITADKKRNIWNLNGNQWFMAIDDNTGYLVSFLGPGYAYRGYPKEYPTITKDEALKICAKLLALHPKTKGLVLASVSGHDSNRQHLVDVRYKRIVNWIDSGLVGDVAAIQISKTDKSVASLTFHLDTQYPKFVKRFTESQLKEIAAKAIGCKASQIKSGIWMYTYITGNKVRPSYATGIQGKSICIDSETGKVLYLLPDIRIQLTPPKPIRNSDKTDKSIPLQTDSFNSLNNNLKMTIKSIGDVVKSWPSTESGKSLDDSYCSFMDRERNLIAYAFVKDRLVLISSKGISSLVPVRPLASKESLMKRLNPLLMLYGSSFYSLKVDSVLGGRSNGLPSVKKFFQVSVLVSDKSRKFTKIESTVCQNNGQIYYWRANAWAGKR